MKKLLASLLLVCLSASLLSCTTPYRPNGLLGGFSEMQLNEGVYKVSFVGNGFSSRDYVQNMLLRRCAELTLQNNYKYFIILSQNTEIKVDVTTTPETVQVDSTRKVQGNKKVESTVTQITPSSQEETKSYTSHAVIKMTNKNQLHALSAAIVSANFQKTN